MHLRISHCVVGIRESVSLISDGWECVTSSPQNLPNTESWASAQPRSAIAAVELCLRTRLTTASTVAKMSMALGFGVARRMGHFCLCLCLEAFLGSLFMCL